MTGYVLDDDNVLNGMTGGNSCVIGGSLNKEGKMTFKSKNMLKTKEEFEEIFRREFKDYILLNKEEFLVETKKLGIDLTNEVFYDYFE